MEGRNDPEKRKPLRTEEIFRLLSNPLRMKLIELIGHRLYTLKGLSKKLGVPKPTLCSHLTMMRHSTTIENVNYKASLRYKLIAKELLPIIRKTRKATERINSRRIALSSRKA